MVGIMSGRIARRAVVAVAAMVVLAVAVAAVDQLFGWRVADREASDTGHEHAHHDSWRDSTVGREKALSRRGFAAPPVPPIHVSPDRRHIVDGDGVPLLIHGDTPWSLAVQLRMNGRPSVTSTPVASLGPVVWLLMMFCHWKSGVALNTVR